MSTRLWVALLAILSTIAIACGGTDIEGTACNDVGSRKTWSDGKTYECKLVEPTRPQDGAQWKRVSG
jgi:hypothetical protein